MTAQELKNSILQLAVEGKLVPHTNENASELLEKIKAEKAKLIANGKIKKEKDLPPIAEDEKPFDIPENWCWCRLGEIIELLSGRDLETSEYNSINKGIPYMTGASNVNSEKLIVNRWTEKPVTVSQKGDLLITCKGTVGELAFNTIGDIHIARQIMAIRNNHYLSMEYMKYFLMSQVGKLKGQAKSMIPGISREDMLTLPIPLPPVSEQKAIVAKIEKLLPYIEKYDAAYTKLEEFNKKFPQDMQKSILQQAVQGKLVPQNKADGNAKDLLAQIKAEKAKLIAEGKIKKEKPLAEITEDEIPFDIPENWCWCRLGEIAETNIGLTYSPSNISEKGIGVLRSNNIQDGKIIYDDIVRVNIEVPENKMCIPGDILICARNGSKRLVGKAALIKDTGFSFGAFMAILRSVCNEYLLYVINSAYFRNYLLPETGTTTINQITQDSLKKVPIPLPPLAEQKRIVAKIEELLPLCKKLER